MHAYWTVAVLSLLVAAAQNNCYADADPLSEQAAQQLLLVKSSPIISGDEAGVMEANGASTGVRNLTWAISQTAHLGGHLKKTNTRVAGVGAVEDVQYYKLTLRGITESSIVTLKHDSVADADEVVGSGEQPDIRSIPQTMLRGLPRFAMLTVSTDKHYEDDIKDAVTNPRVVENMLISLELLEMVDFFEDNGKSKDTPNKGSTAVYVARLTKGTDIVLSTYNGSISTDAPHWDALDHIEFESGVLVVDYFVDPSSNQMTTGERAAGNPSLRSLQGKMVSNYVRNIAKIRGSNEDDDLNTIVKAQGWATWWIPIYGFATISICCPAAFGFGATTLPSFGITALPAIFAFTCCLI